MPTGLYFYQCFFLYFLSGQLSNTCIQEANGPIFTWISGLLDGCKGLFTSLSFFDFSKDVVMAIKSLKIVVFPGPIYFVALPFRNGWQYHNSDFTRFDRMNFSTMCIILVAFSPETWEFTLLTLAPFAAIRQKLAYYPKYLRISCTYLNLLYRFGRRISGDDFPGIRLAVAQGTFLWQPVKFGRCLQT